MTDPTIASFGFVVYGDPAAWRGQSFAIRRVRLRQSWYQDAAKFERPETWRLDGKYAVRVVAFEAEGTRGVDVCDLAKFCLDGLEGVAFTNDSQVAFFEIERVTDGKEPRTEVRVFLLREGP